MGRRKSNGVVFTIDPLMAHQSRKNNRSKEEERLTERKKLKAGEERLIMEGDKEGMD